MSVPIICGGDRALGGVAQEIEPFQGSEHPLEGVDVGVDPVDAVEGKRSFRRLRQGSPVYSLTTARSA